MVKPGREFVPVGDVNIPEGKVQGYGLESILNTESQIIRSHDLIGRVVYAMGAYTLYPDLRATPATGAELQNMAATSFLGDLLVKVIPGSNTLEVYYRNKDPNIAAQTTNKLVELVRDKHIEVFGESKSPMMADQVSEYGKRLNEAMAKLSDFKDKNQITNIGDQFFFIIGNRTNTEGMLKVEESKLEEIQKRLTFLKMHERNIVPDLYTDTTRGKLTDLLAQETRLLGVYKDHSRPVRNVRKELETVRAELYRYEAEKKQSGEFVTLEADLNGQQLKIANVKKSISDLDAQLADLSRKGGELNKMEREISILQTNYDLYTKRYEEALLSEEMDRKKITNLHILEAAAVPVTPVRANLKRIVGIGLFAAFALSFGFAFAAEYMPQHFTTPEAVTRHLKLPVLVAISYKK